MEEESAVENVSEERDGGLEERERQDREKAEDNRARQLRLGDISEESEKEPAEVSAEKSKAEAKPKPKPKA